jgi:hypothetical protein
MRLWSLHPRYLDSKGLVALWREGLLAQAVLAGRTRGYRSHPQLARFKASPAPVKLIAAYLRIVRAEALRRGFGFDAGKIGRGGAVDPIPVTRGQLSYEWAHLALKLRARAPSVLLRFRGVKRPEPNSLFRVVPGGIAEWEALPARRRRVARPS